MQFLYVFYDASCGLCTRLRSWCERQPAYVELRFVPAGTTESARLLPSELVKASREDLAVPSSEGGIYQGEAAWLICLWALEGYRKLSIRLSDPRLAPKIREAFRIFSNNRHALSRWLGLSNEKLQRELPWAFVPRCEPRWLE
jgi:predicted DCC family thiol-disulfide oxidoreductase YuxK